MRSKFNVFLNEAPEITIDENNEVHVIDGQAVYVDDGREVVVDRVMSIHNLRVYVERGEALLEEWDARQSGG